MLEAIERGQAPVEKRSLMQCDLWRADSKLGSYLVFNDAVVNKTVLARLNNYDLYIDKMFVSSYRADGMIIATPTGFNRLFSIRRRPGSDAYGARIRDYASRTTFAYASAFGGARFSRDRNPLAK